MRAVLACAASLLSSSLPAQVPQLDSVNRYVSAELKRQQIPGLSIAVLRGDQVLIARGYGFSNLEHRVPATDSTIYQSGSLGKQFIGAAVAMLAQQGRLNTEDRITKWLPEGKGVWDSITVRQLLTHTSGMPEYTDSLIDLRKDYTEDALTRLAASRPLDFPPGEAWSYSNTGYALLGVLIHRVTGRFYGGVLRQMIFSPLGMRTRIISEADIIPNRAAGYRLVGNQVKNQEWVSPSLNTTADGALYRGDIRANTRAAAPFEKGASRSLAAGRYPGSSPEGSGGQRGRHGHTRHPAFPAAGCATCARRDAAEGGPVDGIGL